MAEKPIVMSNFAGQIAIQAMLSMLTQVLADQFPDPEDTRDKMTKAVQNTINSTLIPDMPEEDLDAIKEQAKILVGLMINGGQSRQN